MKNRLEHKLACPTLVPRGARILTAIGVLATMALVGVLVVDSSEVAVERKLAEFDAVPQLAHAEPADQPGQAPVPGSQHDRYDAALREVETIGCDRAGRHPS